MLTRNGIAAFLATTVASSARAQNAVPGAGATILGTAPRHTQFEFRRGMQIWGVTRGEVDEPHVVRYRIEPVTR